MRYFTLVLIGTLLGVVNVVPGVSSGTMAVVTHTYDYIINTLSLDFKFIKQNFWRILCLGLGLVLGIFGFSFVIKILFEQAYNSTMYFFMGLVVGGIPLIFREAKKQKETAKPWVKYIVFFVAVALLIVFAFISPVDNTTALTHVNFAEGMRLFGCMIIGAAGMILPGVSGSLLMMMMGSYNTIITAISSLNFGILLYACGGALIGIVLGALLLKFLLKRFPKVTFYAILGLVIGSVVAIFPGLSNGWFILVDILSLIIGGVAGYFVSKIGQGADVSPKENKSIKK